MDLRRAFMIGLGIGVGIILAIAAVMALLLALFTPVRTESGVVEPRSSSMLHPSSPDAFGG